MYLVLTIHALIPTAGTDILAFSFNAGSLGHIVFVPQKAGGAVVMTWKLTIFRFSQPPKGQTLCVYQSFSYCTF